MEAAGFSRGFSRQRSSNSLTRASGSAGAKLLFAPTMSRAMQSELRMASSVASIAAS